METTQPLMLYSRNFVLLAVCTVTAARAAWTGGDFMAMFVA
jgi:hypothetical protein